MKLCMLILVVPCLLLGADPLGLPAFRNKGTLQGFTGANQKQKITESREQDADGNGVSLKCVMIRKEPDTPSGGCHAEVHLHRFPDKSILGSFPSFEATTTYRVLLDTNCNAATVGLFQYKNCEGPERWKYLVALWRSAGDNNGERLLFQVNPTGKNLHYYAKLSSEEGMRLAVGQWHTISVTGRFSAHDDGWAEVRINGKPVTWFRDAACKESVGQRLSGAFLAPVQKAEWQLQLGGYAYFKQPKVERATVYLDDIEVWKKPLTWKDGER